jgi:hypothetical protein
MGIRSRFSLSCLVLGLLIAGCGGDDEDDGTVSGAVVRQANSICENANRSAGAELLKAYDLKVLKVAASEEEAVRLEETILLPILISAAETLADGFRGLDIPAEDESQIESVVDAYDTWIDEAKADPRKVALANDNFNVARRLAREYGLVRCAQNPYDVK